MTYSLFTYKRHKQTYLCIAYSCIDTVLESAKVNLLPSYENQNNQLIKWGKLNLANRNILSIPAL